MHLPESPSSRRVEGKHKILRRNEEDRPRNWKCLEILRLSSGWRATTWKCALAQHRPFGYQSLSPSGEVKPFSTHTSLQETRATIGHGSWLWSPFSITTIHSWCDVFSNSRSITAARDRFKMFSFLSCNLRRFVFPIKKS